MLTAMERTDPEHPRRTAVTRWARRLRLGAMPGLLLVLAAAAAADARQVFRETVHDERNVVLKDFCDVEGLTVELRSVLDMRVNVASRGPAGLAYFLQRGVTKEVLRNPATGTSLTSITTVTEKDMRVTENGDGTLTILILATGNAVLYGPDGKAIARNPGQTRFEVLVDDGGTPSDPSDDEFLGRLGTVKESTGRNDDFCEAAVPALTCADAGSGHSTADGSTRPVACDRCSTTRVAPVDDWVDSGSRDDHAASCGNDMNVSPPNCDRSSHRYS